MPDASPVLPAIWNSRLAPFRRASNGRALLQLLPTAALFGLLWWAMTWAFHRSYALTLLLALIEAALTVRLFIFLHDCAHGSFFRWPALNRIVGSVLGVVTLTPFSFWRRHHILHHATAGNLDRRGSGDVDTLTVREFEARSRFGRASYRLRRSPLVFLLVGPIWLFLIRHRLPLGMPLSWSREWRSVAFNNLGVVGVVVLLSQLVGVGPFLAIQAPVFLLSAIAGIWLFYAQHQFAETYWRREAEWDFTTACVEGSTYLELPQPLRWVTGDIGVHHIHHLCSAIPNYRLARSLAAVSDLPPPRRMTLWQSFRCARLALWDEDARRLVGFDELRSRRRDPRGGERVSAPASGRSAASASGAPPR